jgi:hypothetical protein
MATQTRWPSIVRSETGRNVRQCAHGHPDRRDRDDLHGGLVRLSEPDLQDEGVAERPRAADGGGLPVAGQREPEQLTEGDEGTERHRVTRLRQPDGAGMRYGRDDQHARGRDQEQLA